MGASVAVGQKYIHESVDTGVEGNALRSSFVSFMCTVPNIENSPLFANLADFTPAYCAEIIGKYEKKMALFACPAQPNPESKGCVSTLNRSASGNLESLSQNDVEFIAAIVNARKSILTLMSLGSFNDYLSSTQFREWFWTQRVRATQHDNRLYECLKDVQTEDFYSQLSPLSWRDTLFKSLECLPFSVSVADATKEGFPLVFVNSKFQEMSGFSTEDAIGKSNKFLQGGIVEPDMRTIMTETLAAKKICRVFVTNKRKDGTVFRNLLSMKPVSNLQGEYRYVIGMQFDVTAPESSVVAMTAGTDLFDLLPSVTCEE